MQTWSDPSVGRKASPTRRLATYTLLFFSLAGLLAGFAFGGFLHSGGRTTNNTGPLTTITPSTQVTPKITPTPTTQPVVPLGIPQFKPFPSATENADSTTIYTFGMQVVDKQKQAVHASDISCKTWLVQQIPTGQTLNIDQKTLKAVANLGNSITGTINNQPAPEAGGLTFDSTTPQEGLCNPDGQMTWKYTIASTVTPGNYDIVILADWEGIHWNWSWVNITIQ